jgi:phosphate transport system permease protein
MASSIAVGETRSAVERALRGKRADVSGIAFHAMLLFTLAASLAFLVILVWTTWQTAQPVFAERGLDFVTSNVSALAFRAGVRQGIIGSLYLVAIVALVALPLGIAAAIYLQEYARDTRLNRLLITNIRNLAGVPAIVYGILGLVVFVQALRGVMGADGKTILAGALTLSVLVMPIIILITMEALRAVPRSIREAAYGVGATRWEVVRSHVLPYAAPGIFTGAILSLARAFGETAPLLMVGAVLGYLTPSRGGGVLSPLFEKYTALPTQIFQFSRQIGEDWRANAAAAIIVLLVVILLVNAAAIVLRNRYDRKW